MQTVLLGIFLLLHGLVHLLYAGQSRKLFELRPGMTWPDGAWALSRLLGDDGTRSIATILLVLTALGYFTGGVGLLLRQDWWQAAAVGSAVLSTALFILFWNGKLQALDAQGGIGILINLAILVVVSIFKLPA